MSQSRPLMVLTDAAVAAPNKVKALFRIGKVPFPYWEQPQRIQPEPLMAQTEAAVAAPIRTKHVSLRKCLFLLGNNHRGVSQNHLMVMTDAAAAAPNKARTLASAATTLAQATTPLALAATADKYWHRLQQH